MKRTVCFAALAAMAASCNALAVGEIAQVTIIDCSSGAVLTPHLSHGEYWVAGKPGATYAIEIHNRLDERVLTVTSVDGVNVVSGETAAWDQTGYVFRPRYDYRITGWRKSDDEVAAFTFTDSPNSYAARTRRPANVGIIGVAVFRERQPQQVYVPPPVRAPSVEPAPMPKAWPSPEAPAARPPAPSPSPPPVSATALPDSVAREAVAGLPSSQLRSAPAAPATKLGTGHGEREYSHVDHTEFERLHTQPDEVIRIRYDSLDNLIAMGIVAKPHPAIPAANPFPASVQQQYVPDPPAGLRGDLH
jgi:hypothetical protein